MKHLYNTSRKFFNYTLCQIQIKHISFFCVHSRAFIVMRFGFNKWHSKRKPLKILRCQKVFLKESKKLYDKFSKKDISENEKKTSKECKLNSWGKNEKALSYGEHNIKKGLVTVKHVICKTISINNSFPKRIITDGIKVFNQNKIANWFKFFLQKLFRNWHLQFYILRNIFDNIPSFVVKIVSESIFCAIKEIS